MAIQSTNGGFLRQVYLCRVLEEVASIPVSIFDHHKHLFSIKCPSLFLRSLRKQLNFHQGFKTFEKEFMPIFNWNFFPLTRKLRFCKKNLGRSAHAETLISYWALKTLLIINQVMMVKIKIWVFFVNFCNDRSVTFCKFGKFWVAFRV